MNYKNMMKINLILMKTFIIYILKKMIIYKNVQKKIIFIMKLLKHIMKNKYYKTYYRKIIYNKQYSLKNMMI